jgi:hypothetical protein
MKHRFLNYLFSGCIPKDVELTRLYIGDLLLDSFFDQELRHEFSENELIFTCDNTFADRIKSRNDDRNINDKARKRTQKLNLKKRAMESVADDSTKMR